MNPPFDDPNMGTPPGGMPPNSFGGPPMSMNGPMPGMGPGQMAPAHMGPGPQGPPNSFDGPGPGMGPGPPGPYPQGPGPGMTGGPPMTGPGMTGPGMTGPMMTGPGMTGPGMTGPGMMPGPRGPGMHLGPGPGPGPQATGKVYPPNQPMVFNPSNPNAPPIYPCGICHKEVHDNDHAILCESGCNFWFHRVCTGLTEPAYLMLTKEIYAEWVCDKCLNTKNIPVVKVKP